MTVRPLFAAGIVAMLLAACGEDDVILPGERFNLRETPELVNQVRSVALPAAQANTDWTHRNGTPSHQIVHPALGATLASAFVADIGEGDSRRARITADPVVAGGVIYTLDARATVTATSTSGETLWTRNLTPVQDNAQDASGGGLSVGSGQVYVTSGFGEITALDAATGGIRWVQDLDAPSVSSATVFGDLVYVVARNSTAWALEASNGRIRWLKNATPSTANFDKGSAPAVNGDIAIFPFPSGEVIGTFPEGGLQRWSTVVSGDRLGRAASFVSDVSGDPVIVGNRAYVGNFGGRLVALDTFDGTRLWTAADGAISPVWPVGDAIFLLNDQNELVRLGREDGQPVWRISLPNFVNPDANRPKRVVAHYGPVLAGGRLIVTSSDGLIRQFDPTSGALIGSLEIDGGAASAPVVAGQTLYVVSKTGQLHAFR